MDRYDSTDQYFLDYQRKLDEEQVQAEWEEEERRDKMLRGEPFIGGPDLYRDMRRGK